MKPKILFIKASMAPYWCFGDKWLKKEFDTKYILYDKPSNTGRPKYWDIELPQNAHIRYNRIKFNNKYFDFKIKKILEKELPDLVILDGFAQIISNYFAYRYCIKKNIKCALSSEIWRTSEGKPRFFLSKIAAYLFRKVDIFLAPGDHALEHWKNYFAPEKVILYSSPSYIDQYLEHEIRCSASNINLFFGHRLSKEYNPIMALDILTSVQRKHPKTSLYMNATGPLKDQVEHYISDKKINNVEWIDIKSFDDLDLFYRKGDISISPCIYSNGNIGILEASASGMPIIISQNVQYHNLTIEKYNNGFILPLVVKDFSNIIIKYIENPNIMKQHSQNSKLSVEELTNTKFTELLDRILKN